ncbi:MdpB Microcystin-dependent protein [uncultured Caudovirales phage]|uniref:MdpB Microcystin-dependent protein n=1 Tax=uncultured Caudovirales phage TaxID=2100421 RepID=A0A6J5LXH9_9CAUD|nr:MdpB Microcystin-dependent protein [uncultured Caudovirales phage]
MPLETTTFINGLDANNPAAGDTVGQADDHIRLIKASVKATFPNITGTVTPTHTVINALPGRVDTLETGLAAVISAYPGEIRMYGGTTAPSKWLLCQGQTVSRTTYAALFAAIGTAYGSGDGSTTFRIPDLRDRFPRGANGDLGTSGGSTSATTSSAGAHTHSGATGGTAITEAQMPGHTHTGTTSSAGDHQHGTAGWGGAPGIAPVGNYGNTNNYALTGGGTDVYSTSAAGAHSHAFTTSSAGGGQAHTHTVSTDGAHTHTVTVDPPFVSVNFMIFAGV